MFFDSTQTYFSPSVARGKMRSNKKDQKHIYAQEHQRYYYDNFRAGHSIKDGK